jgi:hypothetical protein
MFNKKNYAFFLLGLNDKDVILRIESFPSMLKGSERAIFQLLCQVILVTNYIEESDPGKQHLLAKRKFK